MKYSTLASSAATWICLGFAAPAFAASLSATAAANPPPSAKTVATAKPAAKCLNDLSAFDGQMSKDGHWLGGSRYGYGYPMGGLADGYGRGAMPGHRGATTTGYLSARPGYEVRTLIAAASILGRHGQQQSCEDVLTTTRNIYKVYVADISNGKAPPINVPDWRRRQITAAQPVTGISFRSNELIGTEVRNSQNVALGSVEDLVTSPQNGEIAYLVIGRGGIFGINEKYVAVPWQDFKATPRVSLLVLNASKAAMDAAPQMSKSQFAAASHFAQESQKVNAYWKAHLTNNGKVGSGKSSG